MRPRLLAFAARKNALASQNAGKRWRAMPPTMRMPSGRVADSTWITSAPSVASIPLAAGPAHQAVRSRMRTPASGSRGDPPGARARARLGSGERRARPRRRAARADPRSSRGTGAAARARRPGSSAARRAPRSARGVRTVSPESTGATGMRSAAAASSTSAVVCCFVYACTISFHSAKRAMRPATCASCSSSRSSGRPISSMKSETCWREFVQKPT